MSGDGKTDQLTDLRKLNSQFSISEHSTRFHEIFVILIINSSDNLDCTLVVSDKNSLLRDCRVGVHSFDFDSDKGH